LGHALGTCFGDLQTGIFDFFFGQQHIIMAAQSQINGLGQGQKKSRCLRDSLGQ
jgi:hypothetical protein